MSQMKHTLKSESSGKRGAILSIDVAVAIAIAIIVMLAASFYISKVEDEPLTTVNMYRQVRDITALLDYKGILATMNNNTISSNLSSILDGRYVGQLEVHLYNTTSGNIQYITTAFSHNDTGNNTVITGERITVIDSHIAKVRYWVWLN